MKTTYASVVNAIIRPSRDEYDLSSLGPTEFEYQGVAYQRQDLELKNKRKLTLKCSHFRPVGKDPASLPCVVYLHTSLGSRVEALGVLHVLLPAGVTVFCLDFAGSGLSEGDFISLGYWEREDLAVVLDHLRSENASRPIGLWGRGMGAVAALLQMKEDSDIAAAVLDSPYKSLPDLSKELAKRVVSTFDFLLNQIISKVIAKSVRKKAGFELMSLIPIQDVENVHTPALFAAALQDSYISPLHAEALVQAYGAQVKKIIKFEGDHNSPRPLYFLQEATRFLVQAFTK